MASTTGTAVNIGVSTDGVDSILLELEWHLDGIEVIAPVTGADCVI